MKIVASNSITVSNVNDGTITHTAWSYSADGTDRFTTIYPNLNLLDGTKDFSGDWLYTWAWQNDGTYKNLSVKKKTLQGGGIHKTFTASKDGVYTFSAYIKSSGDNANIVRFAEKNGTGYWDSGAYKEFGNNFDWLRDSFTVTLKARDTISVRYEINGSGSDSIVWTAGHKWEEGSVATPWMPSSSEVATADYPSYIGQYTDFTQADSTNTSDYTWSLMRGNDGKDGADGKDGIAGKDGVGINSTTITYQASTNGTTAPTGTWSASVPTVAKGSFLWTRTILTYTDNTTETGYAVAYMGTNGNNGTNGLAGKDGVGIQTTTITYVGSTSGTTAPTSGWASTVPTVAAGSYLWTKTVWTYTDNTSETGYSVAMMGLKGDKGDPGIKGNDGTDGTSGIIVSSAAPDSPQTGQLWQDTSTTPQLVKKWSGASWVIWKMYVENMVVDTISSMSSDLGDINGGTLKLMADISINGTLKKYGIYQSKLGLLSSGAALATTSTMSNTQMGVVSLNKGELRFIVTDYTENLEDVQDAGMSDQNHAFIKFDSYDNGKDIMTIGSSGDIVFKGNTSQDTQWITLSSGVRYKFMFSRVYISVNIVGNGNQYMQFGMLPQNLRPISDQFLIIANWGTGTADDRHIMVRASDGAVVLWAPKSGITYGGEVSFTL